MHETWTLTKRELHAYFDSPAAYVVLSVFLLFTGWFFSNPLFIENVASLRGLFEIAPFIFLFFVPAITMSLFAEERRAGTLELLLTMPIRDWQIILGKLLAATILLATALGLTFLYVVTLSLLGDLDFGATFGGYFGLLLYGMSCVAIGLLASSLTRNQIVAFILGFAIIFLLYLLDKVTLFVPASLVGLFQYLSIDYHYHNLLRGVIDSRDVLYYLSITLFACMLTAYNLARRPE
jgi:ABC-2 type transport system permease protein